MDAERHINELIERMARLEDEVARLREQLASTSRNAGPGHVSTSSPVEPGSAAAPERAATVTTGAPPAGAMTAGGLTTARVLAQKPVRKRREPVSPTVLIASVAAVIFLTGVVFFFRWAIQQGWIGPEFRIALGLIAGGALTAYAGRQLLGDRARFGVALLIAGLGTLHFTFRVGAVDYNLYGLPLAFAAVALVTLGSGALAARARSSGAMTVSLLSAFVTPIIFGPDGHREVSFALYLAVVMAATLGATFVTMQGARWHLARWTAITGTWLLLLPAAMQVSQADALSFGALLVLHLLLSCLWAWLPWTGQVPGTASALWITSSVLFTSHAWLVWRALGYPSRAFAIPIVSAAVFNVALLEPVRKRMAGRRADGALLALVIGYLGLAAPVALSWRWAGAYWGVFAVTLAWFSGTATRQRFVADAAMLRLLAAGMATLTTLQWSLNGTFGFSVAGGGLPFANPSFAAGALAAAAWLLLVRVEHLPLAPFAFAAFEYAANLTAGFEGARTLQWLNPPLELSAGPSRAASIVITLVWAVSGAAQWMWGLPQQTRQQRAVILAGYAWMALSGFKLIASDLDRADTPLRALAFLGVGGIGMLAAILANRRKSDVTTPAETADARNPTSDEPAGK